LIRSQVVTLQNVAVGLGAGQDHHGNAAQLRMFSYRLQDLEAVLSGKVEIEKDQVGTRHVSEAAGSIEKVQ
jgi:hypothetical protein